MQNISDLSVLYEQGRFAELIESIDFSGFSSVEDPILSQVLAASYFKLGMHQKSLLLLKEIESCFLADSNYLSLYGACLRRCGDLENSRLRFEQALEIRPQDASIRNNYANLLIDLKDYAKAESILLELLSDNPDYEDAKVNLQRLSEKRRLQQLQSDDDHSVESTTWSLADPLMLAFSEEEVHHTRPKSLDPGDVQGVVFLR